MPEKSPWRCPMRSMSRPGVAITRSTEERSASICGRSPTPPNTVAIRSGRYFGIRADVLLDLHDQFPRRRDDQGAGSRGGGPGPGEAESIERIGRTNAAVLPVPVWAMPMRS